MQYHQQSTDMELLGGCRLGSEQAQFVLYKRYYGLVMSVALRYAQNRDEATEVVNIAFYKVMSQAHRYESTGPFGGWVRTIALHTSIDFVRSRASYQKRISATEVLPDVPIDNEAIEKLSEAEILNLVQQLPDASRLVFSLFVIEGFGHEEIAEQLGIPVGTSKWHLSNARATLKEKLSRSKSNRIANYAA